MKIKKSKNVIKLLALAMIGLVFTVPFVYDYVCRNRVYDEFASKITKDILLANVHIVKCVTDKDTVSYSVGFGGGVFQKEENKYYVLTAYHALESLDNSVLRVIRYEDLSYSELCMQSKEYISLKEYYFQLPVATVEYYNEEYDLAILSFHTDENVGVLKIAEQPSQYKDRIISISKPANERDTIITYGRITSKEPKTITFQDGSKTDYIIRHSAYEAEGSSGSVVLNENYEMAGINIGGGKDIFENFRYGYAIPSEQIKLFLKEWIKHEEMSVEEIPKDLESEYEWNIE